MKQAIVMGVGAPRGLGAALARRFAQQDYSVHVAGRTLQRLEETVATITAAGGRAQAHAVDCRDPDGQRALFDAAATEGPIELAIYNAGNAFPGAIAEITPDYFREAWEVCCFGGFLFAQNATRHMAPNGRGTLLYTGASASLRGRANFSPFNSAKAALRTLAQAVAKEYGPHGIHVGHVIIDGAIHGDMVQTRWPKHYDALGKEGMVDIEGIVDAYAFLHAQSPTSWSFELDLRTAQESW